MRAACSEIPHSHHPLEQGIPGYPSLPPPESDVAPHMPTALDQIIPGDTRPLRMIRAPHEPHDRVLRYIFHLAVNPTRMIEIKSATAVHTA